MTTELTTTSILALFQTTKEERQSFALDLISKIENGEADPLKIHLQLKCAEDLIKQINANTIYKKALLDAAESYGQKSFEFHNSKVEVKEAGVKYDYSKCNDPEYVALAIQQTELDGKVKERESFLKSVPSKGLEIVNTETGETGTIYPPAKSSTTTVAITLK